MSGDGVVHFERDGQGQLMIVLLVQGIPIARSRKAANIAAEVALRGLDKLAIGNALVVAIPTNGDTLDMAAASWPAAPEFDAVLALIAACRW